MNPDPETDETPDGEAARGSGAGVAGAGEPIAFPPSPYPDDLQEELGEDPTPVDKYSGN